LPTVVRHNGIAAIDAVFGRPHRARDFVTRTSATCPQPPAPLTYQPALDGLRAIAVVAVMLFHAGLPLFQGGFLGVDIFFVLSGYLITTLLTAEFSASGAGGSSGTDGASGTRATRGRIALGRFYMRRALRLFPALLLLVAFLQLVSPGPMFPDQLAEMRREMVTTLLYVANWAQAARIVEPLGFLSHTWSLAIEEQFYIVWPLVLGWLLRSVSRAAACWIVAAGALASALARAAMWNGPESFARVFHGSDTRAEALLAGCLLALLLGQRRIAEMAAARRTAVGAGAAAAALVLAWLFSHATTEAGWMYRGGFSLAAAAAMLLILELRTAPRGVFATVLSVVAAVVIGRISYGLYLWHWPIFLILTPSISGLAPGATQVVRFAATFIVATLSWFLLERPVLSWKRRWS